MTTPYTRYPTSGSTTVTTSWTSILPISMPYIYGEDNFGAIHVLLENTGTGNISSLRFRHSFDGSTYSEYFLITDAQAAALASLLSASSKLSLLLYVPMGSFKIEAKTATGNTTVVAHWERAEVTFNKIMVNGMYLDDYLSSAGVAEEETDEYNGDMVNAPYTLFEDTHEKDLLPLKFIQAVVNNGTITFNDDRSCAELNITTTDTDSAMLRSKETFKFQPGKTRVAMIDFCLSRGSALNNVKEYVGMFNDNDGFMLYRDGGATTPINFVVRSSVSGAAVDTATGQTAWNVDPFDGTGPSGKTLDLGKLQTLYIEYGNTAGWVKFGFVIDGKIYIAHKQFVGNTEDTPITSWLSLPITSYILNDGGTAAGHTLEVYNYCIMSRGASNKPEGTRISYTSGNTAIALNVNDVRVLCVRPLGASNYMYGSVKPQGGTILCRNAKFAWRMIVDATLAGAPAWANSSTNRSQHGMDNVAVPSGYVVASGFGYDHCQLPELDDEILKAYVDGTTPEIIALEITALDPLNMYATFDYKEYM